MCSLTWSVELLGIKSALALKSANFISSASFIFFCDFMEAHIEMEGSTFQSNEKF